MDGKRKALTFVILLAVIFFLAASARHNSGRVHYIFTQPAMGTIFNVTCYDADENIAREAVKKAFALLHVIESELSRFREGSEIDTLNKNPQNSIKISGHLFDCLKESILVGEITGGYFDITFLPLYKMWDWRNNPQSEPSCDSIETALALVGYKKIKIDDSERSVRLEKNMMIDLGGLAKGYAVGKMAELLNELGIKDAIVEGGGDIMLTAKRPYMIGIQHPFTKKQGELFGRLSVNGPAAVFTSGDYEQYCVINGKKYGHIIDPITGYPSSGLKSVTILESGAARADGLATGIIAMGEKPAGNSLN